MSALTWGEYQCPFGLKLHFYESMIEANDALNSYQCPFGLVLHFYSMNTFRDIAILYCINALSG